ncbi:glycosyltransferase family 2 protein [Methanosarcina sp. MSH10X1]|uniref:glycosyltransferase family 2 protein n=1 Tax=Methanosarcina sp. MSH10X1 TaxID=2507075 RepID=UPI000FFC77B7|nr:glycosyltransferase family 2 protein [Methanosarcina sp. MSH10X1]RXA21936.1 glycosyltransferase family 2 protein [Methanosarcina sp. MSH10X1]
MTDSPDITVIIPNYNGKHYLDDCLTSLTKQSYKNFEVTIIDNASSDGSLEYIKTNFPQFNVIENSHNLGFSKAVNQGARLSKATFLAILNNDTVVDSRCLEEFINFTKMFDDFGSCQSKVLLYDHKDVINTIGNEIFYLGLGWSGGYGQHEQSYNDIKEVTYCSGASLFVKRDVLQQVGYFDDEEVFMYHDDLDLGWRLLLYGYKNYFAPKSIVYHKYQYNRNNKKYYFLEVSRFVSIIKYYEFQTILLIFPVLFTLEIGIILFSIYKGWFKSKIKSYAYIFSNFGRLLEKRKRIQKSRLLPDKSILSYFTDEIKFKELDNICLRFVNPLFHIYWQVIKKVI